MCRDKAHEPARLSQTNFMNHEETKDANHAPITVEHRETAKLIYFAGFCNVTQLGPVAQLIANSEARAVAGLTRDLSEETRQVEQLKKSEHDGERLWRKACAERDALAAQVAAINAWLDKEYGPKDRRSDDLLDDLGVFLDHHKSLEAQVGRYRLTRSFEEGVWLHIETPSGLKAGINLGHLNGSIANRAINECLAATPEATASQYVPASEYRKLRAEFDDALGKLAEDLKGLGEDKARMDWLEHTATEIRIAGKREGFDNSLLVNSEPIREVIDAARKAGSVLI